MDRYVICAHGLSRNCRDFDALAQNLVAANPGTRVIAIGTLYPPFTTTPTLRLANGADMPGRGNSGWLSNKLNYNYNTYQMVATTLLARLQAPVIDWIGISMGGILGMKLSALANTPIRKLVLVDVGPFVPRDSLVRIGTYLGKEPLFRTVDEYKARAPLCFSSSSVFGADLSCCRLSLGNHIASSVHWKSVIGIS